MRTKIRPVALVGAAAAATLLAGVSTASAEVACNRWNECWRVHDRSVAYPPAAKVVFHDDKWASHHTGPAWRWLPDKGDRGYYQHGVWTRF